MIKVFRCARTGMYYPLDYIEQWGHKYGQGLGPEPVSEALYNRYEFGLVGKDITKKTYPVGIARSQLDFVVIDEEEYAEHFPIYQIDDRDYGLRAPLMRAKAVLKETEQLHQLVPEQVKWATEHVNRYKESSVDRLKTAGIIPVRVAVSGIPQKGGK